MVIDELHMVCDPHRGLPLELSITKLLFSKHAQHIQLVGMSATMGGKPVVTFCDTPECDESSCHSISHVAHDHVMCGRHMSCDCYINAQSAMLLMLKSWSARLSHSRAPVCKLSTDQERTPC